jgi:hypothetical protein
MEHGKIGITLEYLSDQATPITYSVSKNADGIHNSRTFSGIYIPAQPAQEKPAYLILEKQHYRENQEYAICIDEQVYKIQIQNIERKTIKYVFCQIDRMERQDKAA